MYVFALLFACKIIIAKFPNRNSNFHARKLTKSIRCFQTKPCKNSRFHENCMLFKLAGSAVHDLHSKLDVSLIVLVDMNHAIPFDKMQ